jgi:NADPH:quinone reductase-like Zn-dependent oxidoreductase
MKAIVHTKYGPPEALELREIEKPTPGDGEILIKVRAATMTAGDCELRRSDIMPLFWLPLRLYVGLFRPRGNRVLGQEFAGEVEAVGAGVTRFKPGDAVFGGTGLRLGAHAEYVRLPEKGGIALKPPGLSFEQAAAIPVGGQNALHFLRQAEIQPGRQVLIYGSSGSIGTFAVQLAKHFGADVTAVCSTGKIEMVRSLGADHIIDYTGEDFSQRGPIFDVVFDTVGKSGFARSMRALKDNGAYIQANPSMSDMLRGPWTSRRTDKRVILNAAGDSSENLAYLAGLVEDGTLVTVIDRSYPLEQTVAAHKYVELGHKAGNVIITVAHDDGNTGEET